MKDKAYLFGPFFGELSWEYFRFAPYAIHLKKNEPNTNIIIFTRPSRFDLYGKYADILIPLNFENKENYKAKAFKLFGFDSSIEMKLADSLRIKYKKRYSIKEIFTPDTSSLRYNLKWQFPRDKMDYDFLPRKKNTEIIQKIISTKKFFITDEGFEFFHDSYSVIDIKSIRSMLGNIIDDVSCTYIGCLIELIKKTEFVVSNLSSDIGRLSLLLKKPLIYPKRSIQTDAVNLLNPYKTPVIDCNSILEGISIYENNL